MNVKHYCVYLRGWAEMNIILATIFAHLVSDFIIQSDKTSEEKTRLRVIGLIKHYFEVLIPLIMILLLQFRLCDIILYSLIVSFMHIVIDIAKAPVQKSNSEEISAKMFIIDQLIHVISVILLITLSNFKFEYNNYFNDKVAQAFLNTFIKNSNFSIYNFI